MKKLMTIFMLILLVGCGMTQEEQLVSDYEQDLEGTKIDLKLKILDSKIEGEITGADSSIYLRTLFDSLVEARLEDRRLSLKDTEVYIRDTQLKIEGESYPEVKKVYEDALIKYNEMADRIKKQITELEENPDSYISDDYLEKLKSYNENPEKVYGRIFYCKYRAFHPFLQTDQEVENRYIIDPGSTKIIKKL